MWEEGLSNLCAELREILSSRFSDGELQSLAADLGVAWEDLPGAGKTDKARELVAWFERRRGLRRLMAAIEALRPDVQLTTGGAIIGCDRVHIRRGHSVEPFGSDVERTVERLADSMDAVKDIALSTRADVRVLQTEVAAVKTDIQAVRNKVNALQATLIILLSTVVILLAIIILLAYLGIVR